MITKIRMHATELRDLQLWLDNHREVDRCRFHRKSEQCSCLATGDIDYVDVHEYPGEIGSRKIITCACGAENDITNYDLW